MNEKRLKELVEIQNTSIIMINLFKDLSDKNDNDIMKEIVKIKSDKTSDTRLKELVKRQNTLIIILKLVEELKEKNVEEMMKEILKISE